MGHTPLDICLHPAAEPRVYRHVLRNVLQPHLDKGLHRLRAFTGELVGNIACLDILQDRALHVAKRCGDTVYSSPSIKFQPFVTV